MFHGVDALYSHNRMTDDSVDESQHQLLPIWDVPLAGHPQGKELERE